MLATFQNLFSCHTGEFTEELHWAGNFQLGRAISPKGPRPPPLFRGQSLDHFLTFSQICWQAKRRNKLLFCKLATWGSVVALCHNTEQENGIKTQADTKPWENPILILNIRCRKLFRGLFLVHIITLGLGWCNPFCSILTSSNTTTNQCLTRPDPKPHKPSFTFLPLFAVSSIKPNQYLPLSPFPSTFLVLTALPLCSASLKPPLLNTCKKTQRLSPHYFGGWEKTSATRPHPQTSSQSDSSRRVDTR